MEHSLFVQFPEASRFIHISNLCSEQNPFLSFEFIEFRISYWMVEVVFHLLGWGQFTIRKINPKNSISHDLCQMLLGDVFQEGGEMDNLFPLKGFNIYVILMWRLKMILERKFRRM